MSVYIKGMTIPPEGEYCMTLYVCPEGSAYIDVASFPVDEDRFDAIPVPDHGRLLNVLKTERECVSRDCDRDCGKCDLALDRAEILATYDALIAMLSTTAEEEKEG